MRSRAKLILVGAITAIAAAPHAYAKDEPKDAKDPNEIVCEKQTVLGSRLAKRKVCATRAEWAEKRRLDKQAADRGRQSACVPTSTATGQTAC